MIRCAADIDTRCRQVPHVADGQQVVASRFERVAEAAVAADSRGIIDPDDFFAVGRQQSQHRIELRTESLRNDLKRKALPRLA